MRTLQIIRIAVWTCSRARRGAVRATHAAVSTTAASWLTAQITADPRCTVLVVRPGGALRAWGPGGPQVAKPGALNRNRRTVWVFRSRLELVSTNMPLAYMGAGPPDPHGWPLTRAVLRNIMIL